jgi:hypothetical protein
MIFIKKKITFLIDLGGKMPTKVQFIREVHNVNKIPIDPKEKKKKEI